MKTHQIIFISGLILGIFGNGVAYSDEVKSESKNEGAWLEKAPSVEVNQSTVQIQDSKSAPSAQNWSVGWESSLVNMDNKIGVGLFFTDHLLVRASLGHMETSYETGSGNLEDWQYIGYKNSISGHYISADFQYFLKGVSLRETGPYITAGLGLYYGQYSFHWDRYRPYNGAFCFGCSNKILEESGQSSSSVQRELPFQKIGFGYIWSFKIKKSALNLFTDVQYLNISKHESVLVTLGNRSSLVSSAEFNKFLLSFGLSFSFN